jgi:hypothetical protein
MPAPPSMTEKLSPTGAVVEAAKERAAEQREVLAKGQTKLDAEVFARMTGQKPAGEDDEDEEEQDAAPAKPKAKAEEERKEGRPTKNTAKESEPDDESEDADAGDDGEDESEAGESAFQKAHSACKRFGLTEDDLHGLSKKATLALAKSLQVRQDKQDATWRELQELRKSKETGTPKSKSSPSREGSGDDELDEEVEALIAPFKDDAKFEPEVQRSFRTLGKNLKTYVGQIKEQLLEQINRSTDTSYTVMFDRKCDKLADRYPELDDSDERAKARTRMFTLLSERDYTKHGDSGAMLAAALDEAVEEVWGKRKSKKSDASKARDESRMRQGAMTPAGLRGSPKQLSGEDADMAAFMAMRRGAGVADMRVAMNGTR